MNDCAQLQLRGSLRARTIGCGHPARAHNFARDCAHEHPTLRLAPACVCDACSNEGMREVSDKS